MLENLAYLSQILGGVGIFVAAVTLLVHRNQLNFEVIANCTERFQRILADLESEDDATRELAKLRYVDLCNEELFYFRRGYLPRDVMEEWLDGMVDRLPLWKAPNAEEVHPGHRGELGEELFSGYSRIKEAFAVDEPPSNLAQPAERKALVRRLRKNVEPRLGIRPIAERSVDHLRGLIRAGRMRLSPERDAQPGGRRSRPQGGEQRKDEGRTGSGKNSDDETDASCGRNPE